MRTSFGRLRFTILPRIVPWRLRFGQDVRVAILSFGSMALWVLGYPEAAVADADRAVSYARETGQAATLMYALGVTALTHVVCGNYATASAMLDELAALVDEKGALHWKGLGMSVRGWLSCTNRQSLGRSPNNRSLGSSHIGQQEQHRLCRCC